MDFICKIFQRNESYQSDRRGNKPDLEKNDLDLEKNGYVNPGVVGYPGATKSDTAF